MTAQKEQISESGVIKVPEEKGELSREERAALVKEGVERAERWGKIAEEMEQSKEELSPLFS